MLRNGNDSNYICGTSGRLFKITCPYFLPQEGKNVFNVGTKGREHDVIRCGRGKHRRLGYYRRNALKCLNCAFKYGYAEIMVRNE